MIFHVVMEKAEDGWFVVECPALPGCVSQGKTEAGALENIKEAITDWLWAEDQKSDAVINSRHRVGADLSSPISVGQTFLSVTL